MVRMRQPLREEPRRTGQGAEVLRLFPEPVRKRGQESEQSAGSIRDRAAAPEELSREGVRAQRAGAVGVGNVGVRRQASVVDGRSQDRQSQRIIFFARKPSPFVVYARS